MLKRVDNREWRIIQGDLRTMPYELSGTDKLIVLMCVFLVVVEGECETFETGKEVYAGVQCHKI